jgi:hypothetical protein
MVILQLGWCSAPRAGGAGVGPARGVGLPGAVEVSGVKGGRRPSPWRSRQRPLRLEGRSRSLRGAETSSGGVAASVVVPVGEHVDQATSASGSSVSGSSWWASS